MRRRTEKVATVANLDAEKSVMGQTESDNHAATHAVGRNFTLMYYTGRVCDVIPFSERYEPLKNVDIVTAATAWDDPESGETVILVFNEALWFLDEMEHSLVNPN